MKAVQIKKYGGNEVLELIDVPKPKPGNNQILVGVNAASINPFDLAVRAGGLGEKAGIQLPFTPGGDYAGKVLEVGEDVSDFALGDEVYGSALVLSGGSGSFAEIACANVANSDYKPRKVNFTEAAVLPLVGSSAVQALEEHIKLQTNQKILIHGGAGGIGHIAIQLAKSKGAYGANNNRDERFGICRKIKGR